MRSPRSLIGINTIEEFGERDEVYAIAQETMQQGNGAARQRGLYKPTGSLEDVVNFVVRETAKGTTVFRS